MTSTEEQIGDLESRVAKLEAAVFGKHPKKGVKKGGIEKQYSGATGGVRLLVDNGFFDKKRTFGEVRSAVADKGYHYSKQAVQQALTGLSTGTSSPLVALKETGGKRYARRK